jgi:hypothetical protein
MKNLVTIPLVNGRATASFPEKCVYCGIPHELTVPITVSRTTGSQYNRVTQRVTFDVPYCNEHALAGRKYRRWLSVIFLLCLAFSCTAQILISFALDLQEPFQVFVLGPILALLFAFLVGNLGVRKIWGAMNEVMHDLPGNWVDGGLGLQMMMGSDEIGLSFTSESFAREFARLNNRIVQNSSQE